MIVQGTTVFGTSTLASFLSPGGQCKFVLIIFSFLHSDCVSEDNFQPNMQQVQSVARSLRASGGKRC